MEGYVQDALKFATVFLLGLAYAAPVLILLAALIVAMGRVVAKREGWSHFDGQYWAYITALTVGYGDLHPTRKLSKVLATFIATVGIVFTAIIVAAALRALHQVIQVL